MPFKLTAPTDATTIIGNRSRDTAERRTRIILGVGYTDNPQIVQWAAERGYTVAPVQSIPAEYLEQSGRLDAWPDEITLSPPDGADPDQKYRFTAGTTQYDIRDVIAGRI